MKGTKPRLVIDNDAVSTVPRAPSWFSKDAAAEWRRIMPALVARRILTKADLGCVENYCCAIGAAREAERHIQAHGQIYEAHKEMADGRIISLGMKRNPSVGIQKEAMQAARQYAAELGLTPVSRSRPSIRDESDEDDLLT